jgi:hypothetical protein
MKKKTFQVDLSRWKKNKEFLKAYRRVGKIRLGKLK